MILTGKKSLPHWDGSKAKMRSRNYKVRSFTTSMKNKGTATLYRYEEGAARIQIKGYFDTLKSPHPRIRIYTKQYAMEGFTVIGIAFPKELWKEVEAFYEAIVLLTDSNEF